MGPARNGAPRDLPSPHHPGRTQGPPVHAVVVPRSGGSPATHWNLPPPRPPRSPSRRAHQPSTHPGGSRGAPPPPQKHPPRSHGRFGTERTGWRSGAAGVPRRQRSSRRGSTPGRSRRTSSHAPAIPGYAPANPAAAAAKIDDARKFLLLNFVETYVQLDDSEQEEYETLLRDERNREVATMAELTLTTNADRLAHKHYVEGLEKGREQGQRELLLRQLTRRFGPLPEATRQRIQALTSSEELLPARGTSARRPQPRRPRPLGVLAARCRPVELPAGRHPVAGRGTLRPPPNATEGGAPPHPGAPTQLPRSLQHQT